MPVLTAVAAVATTAIVGWIIGEIHLRLTMPSAEHPSALGEEEGPSNCALIAKASPRSAEQQTQTDNEKAVSSVSLSNSGSPAPSGRLTPMEVARAAALIGTLSSAAVPAIAVPPVGTLLSPAPIEAVQTHAPASEPLALPLATPCQLVAEAVEAGPCTQAQAETEKREVIDRLRCVRFAVEASVYPMLIREALAGGGQQASWRQSIISLPSTSKAAFPDQGSLIREVVDTEVADYKELLEVVRPAETRVREQLRSMLAPMPASEREDRISSILADRDVILTSLGLEISKDAMLAELRQIFLAMHKVKAKKVKQSERSAADPWKLLRSYGMPDDLVHRVRAKVYRPASRIWWFDI